MMRLRLRRLRWLVHDRCVATFELDGEEVEVAYDLVRSRLGIGVNPNPDVYIDCDGTAAEILAINAIIIRFCLAAQGGAEQLSPE